MPELLPVAGMLIVDKLDAPMMLLELVKVTVVTVAASIVTVSLTVAVNRPRTSSVRVTTEAVEVSYTVKTGMSKQEQALSRATPMASMADSWPSERPVVVAAVLF